METVVGIDLGTTNTVVAAVRGGRAEALRDVNGDTLIPSVVSFHPNGNVLVGRAAKDRRLVDAKNTIYSIKRLIGRTWDAEEVRLARPRFPFEMRQGPGQAPLVVARGESYTLGEISAFVLRKAKAVAEKALGSAIERTVITVPANFNDLQRAATKVAGRVAGLDVIRILNEPTAAALAYGYGKAPSGRIAVYDFGGGTFDVTLLDLSQNVFEVLATAGDTFLGGDDIDLVIADHMADAFLAQHRIDPRTDPQSFERLRAGAEQIKIQLSTQERSTITLGEVAHGRAGASLDLTFAMTRADLDAIAVPFVDRTLEVCGRALSTAGLSVRDFGAVLLVGGSTRLTLVRRRVQEYFGRADFGSVNPDEVVAIGAALQAAALAGREQSEIPKPPALSRSSRSPALPLPPPVPPPPSFRERLASSADAVKAPETVGGLGARGRQRTKTGLGFAAQQAQAMELRDPPGVSA
ncbi:MAG TPA: Hsp70 family protein, partial [Polyangiaceae bacterium]